MKTPRWLLPMMILALGALIGGAIMRVLFPRNIGDGVPVIRTVWDTVEVVKPRLDTVWRIKVVTRVSEAPNLIDTVTMQAAPETVLVHDTVTLEAVCPQSLQVGQYGARDRPTVLEGATYTYDTSSILRRRPWRVTYFTPGPLDAMIADTFPPQITFRPKPRECGFLCRLGLVSAGILGGGLAGVTACELGHIAH